jgi:hypothetical protein
MQQLESIALPPQHRSERETSDRRSDEVVPDAAHGRDTPEPMTWTERDRLDALLDEGLSETFPASDPVAVSPPGLFG